MGLRGVAGLSGRTIDSPTFTGNVTGAMKDFAKWGIPFIHLSSGSIGNNGALTGVTALPTTFSNGAWVLLPAGAIAAGVPAAAAWYWCVFSSTTAGTIYNSTYSSGVPGLGTATAFATTGPGAFTGLVTENNGPSISITAGAMGANGMIEVDTYLKAVGAGGGKTIKTKFGATTVYTAAPGTGDASNRSRIANLSGVQTAQVAGNFPTISTDSVGLTFPAENTANAVTVAISLQKASATDHAILPFGGIRVAYGA